MKEEVFDNLREAEQTAVNNSHEISQRYYTFRYINGTSSICHTSARVFIH